MTEIKCIEAERIGNVLEYPADHPVRRHADECPRCRVLMQSYRAFLSAAPAEGSDATAARTRLDAAIARGADVAFPATTRPTLRLSAGGRARAWWRPLPVFAAAAMVVAIAAVLLWPDQDSTSQLRTSGDESGPWRIAASVSDDGVVSLRWDAVAGADAYEVRVYGPELEPLLQLPSTGQSISIDRSALPESLPAGAVLTWRVTALRSGDVVETSEPGALSLP